ncbi:hypothetical protein [Planotetraspora kaengkrachanensis]|uniref:Uncharacterized protein n=1 Tax=Planotetraspora kaengkrachanensis TaxID=575193 RepID=A0A8J3M0U6_9ACTN|nr:hypothetical protein [Planotetraspora kaengkrachanensis]GIG80008.1 hypothetical protein Pka01_31350 [Planotetraspora kaengkrachanensis]
MISRHARSNLIEETVNAVGGDHPERRPLRWRGEDVPWPVVQVPVTHALLNPYSHRIKAQVNSLGGRGQVIADDPFGEEAQHLIAEIIRETSGYSRIKATLARDKQQDPGVITREGVLVNANTRLVALCELGVQYIKVQVLPADATQAELTELELGFQMSPDVRQDYSFTNELIFIKDLLDAGWSPERIGLEMDRALDRNKEAHRKQAAQHVETNARLLQLIETIMATSAGKLTYDYFDDEIQNIKDIDSAYESHRKKDPQGALRVRDAKVAGMLAGLDYRKVRQIDETLLNNYVVQALEEEEALKAIAVELATGSIGNIDDEDLDGLDILDDVGDEVAGTSQVTLLPIYRVLATTNDDDAVVLPAGVDDSPVSMPKRVFVAAVNTALTVAIAVKDQDNKGKDELRSPMRHLENARDSCDRARDALTAVARHQSFSINKLQTVYEDYMRSHDELMMVLQDAGIRMIEDGGS